jgi:aminoglycoside 6'-N-acetyltransferase
VADLPTDRLTLTGPRLTLRPGTEHVVPRLSAILLEPAVAMRWGPLDDDELERHFVGSATAFVLEVDGDVIGAIQFGEELDPMYRHASVDIFVTTGRHRQGFGSEAIEILRRYLFDDRGHHRLTIDPAADNEAAIAAYEKVGFRRVGVMLSYERGPDGTWHDGLLMEMLASDLRRGW